MELRDLYSRTIIIRVIKYRMRWAGHVACIGARTGVYSVWWGSLKERDYLEDLVVDWRVILKWILNKVRQVTGYDI